MDLILVFVLMFAGFMIVGFFCAISENKRRKAGKPSRYPESRIMILRRIDRRK